MILTTLRYTPAGGWDSPPDAAMDSPSTLVIVFGPSQIDPCRDALDALVGAFPHSVVVGCSTAGEIHGDTLDQGILSVAVIRFRDVRLKLAVVPIGTAEEASFIGGTLGGRLEAADLKAVFLLSDGLVVNGTKLVDGFRGLSAKGVVVTGGLAGDGARFVETWVLVDGEPRSGFISAVGLYGDSLRIAYGTQGGWDVLDDEIEVAHAIGNVLYELNNQPALAFYKAHMGEDAQGLPSTGLLYPLAIKGEDGAEDVVRTILSVDEEEQSLTFAGTIPDGASIRLMRANMDRLIDGARGASIQATSQDLATGPSLCIAISCVGRRLVLGERTDEELAAVSRHLPLGTRQIGFYSYGEISPLANGVCNLHNQTMTLTLIGED